MIFPQNSPVYIVLVNNKHLLGGKIVATQIFIVSHHVLHLSYILMQQINFTLPFYIKLNRLTYRVAQTFLFCSVLVKLGFGQFAFLKLAFSYTIYAEGGTLLYQRLGHIQA